MTVLIGFLIGIYVMGIIIGMGFKVMGSETPFYQLTILWPIFIIYNRPIKRRW